MSDSIRYLFVLSFFFFHVVLFLYVWAYLLFRE